MKKLLSLLLALALALSLFSGCANTPATSDNSTTDNSTGDITTPTETQSTTIMNREGKEITRPTKLGRIISAAPAITEVLVDLGLTDSIIATDLYSDGITGIKSDITKIDFMTPNAETMLALQPDLIIASGISQAGGSADPFAPLTEAGVVVVYIPTSTTLQGIMDDIAFIADLTNTKDKGDQLIADMTTEINAIKAIGSTVTEKKKVYFEISPDPAIYTFGGGTFLNEMIEITGAVNIFADQNSWLAATAESVIAANPDIILTNVNYTADPVGEIKGRKGWENVSAIKSGSVYSIDTNSSSRPSHLVVKALKEMAKAIYPDLYK